MDTTTTTSTCNNTTNNPLVILSDLTKGTTIRASSVLQKKIKLYGPKNAIDYMNQSSSWNSEGIIETTSDSSQQQQQQQQQYLIIDFNRTVQPKTIHIQYQAGFGSELLQIQYYYSSCDNNDNSTTNTNTANTTSTIIEEESIITQDTHDVQIVDLLVSNKNNNSTSNSNTSIRKMKIIFNELVDFYGRVIVYQLQILGNEHE